MDAVIRWTRLWNHRNSCLAKSSGWKFDHQCPEAWQSCECGNCTRWQLLSLDSQFLLLVDQFSNKNKATYLDILFQNKLGDSIWYAQNPNPVPNSSYWTGISWMNVLAGHCEWGATPLHRLPSWCHSTSWFLKSSGFIKVHSSSLHCSHTQAPPWNPSGDFQTLSYSSQCLSTSHPLEEVDYWIRHGVIRILSLVKAWNDCTLNSGDTMDTSRSAPVWRSCPSFLVGKADLW